MRSVRPVLLSCAAGLLIVCAQPALAIRAAADTRDLLLRYASGEFGVLDKADKFDAASVRRDLERLSAEFLAMPSVRPDLPRRALACFTFEVSAATAMTQFPDSMRLLDWARQKLMAASPGEFERHWHLASIGLIEEIGDYVALDRAAAFALQQFPDEPRFRLAHALAAEVRAAASASPDWSEASARFAHAASLEAARAEAQIHLAYVDLRQGHPDLVIKHLASVEAAAGDRSTAYLLHLLRGRALADAKHDADAEAAYQLALREVPGAQSATMGLAVALVDRGERNRANDVIDTMLKSKTVDDPWWHYWNADYRFRDQRIADLRGDLK